MCSPHIRGHSAPSATGDGDDKEEEEEEEEEEEALPKNASASVAALSARGVKEVELALDMVRIPQPFLPKGSYLFRKHRASSSPIRPRLDFPRRGVGCYRRAAIC